MYELKRLVISLDLTEMDEVLLNYSSKLADEIDADKVYFLHVAENFDIPEKVKEKYPDLLAPTDESIKSILKKKIDENWRPKRNIETAVEVREGDAFDVVLKFVDNKGIDLLIMGRKKILKGSGLLPQKLTNLIHSSVLMVPEKVTFDLSKLVVPLDFSKHSNLAVNQGIRLSEKAEAKLQFIHIYSVPLGYHSAGKSYEEFAEIMRQHAIEDFDEFVEKMEIKHNFDCDYVLDDDRNPSDKIFEYADKNEASLIIMGSKGRTGLASILLGSVTSKVVQFDVNIPLLIVKEKKENMGFLKALLNI